MVPTDNTWRCYRFAERRPLDLARRGLTLSPEGRVVDAGRAHAPHHPRAAGPAARTAMIKWTHIESLEHIVRDVDIRDRVYGVPRPRVTWRPKVKLHGTNAGVRLHAGGVTAQSRSRDLAVGDDNMGFAAWVQARLDAFESLRDRLFQSAPVTLFGEWCGQGIMKGTALNQLDARCWAVFAIQYGDSQSDPRVDVEPDRLRALLPAVEGLYVLPWAAPPIAADFADLASVEAAAAAANRLVGEVETCDPWVKATFGVEGCGEGVVLYPWTGDVAAGPVERDRVTELMFKAKGQKHRVKKRRAAAVVDPAVIAGIEAFVGTFVTEARLEQAAAEACGGAFDKRRTGAFLKWIGQDIQRESARERDAAGLSWKQLAGPVSRAARDWYLGHSG